MRVARVLMVVCVVQTLAIVGCSPKPREFPKDTRKLTPVTGIVKIDGEPASGISVLLMPEESAQDTVFPRDLSVDSFALTDKDGKFSISTIGRPEGAPAGKFVMLFRKLQLGDLAPDPSTADADNAFLEKYSNAARSEHKVTVEEGKPLDLGTIELQSR